MLCVIDVVVGIVMIVADVAWSGGGVHPWSPVAPKSLIVGRLVIDLFHEQGT